MTKRARSYCVRLVVVAMASVLMVARSTFGHCDTMDGPVIKDAQAALEKGDVTPVLKWVPAADEDVIRQAFARAQAARARGPEAKELADRHFFEALVHLHRASEGAPYTGLKPAGTPMPAPVAGSDEALEQGNVDALAGGIAGVVEAGIRERFAAAAEARKHKDESIEAGRKFVAAYVEFVHYVEAVHDIAMGHGAHHGEKPPAVDEHPARKTSDHPAPKHGH